MISDGIKELEEKIEGMRKAQAAMKLLPEIEGVVYWGTSQSVCWSIKEQSHDIQVLQELLVEASWLPKQRLDGTYSHFSENTKSEIMTFTHPKTNIELVLYIEPEKEAEE